jgi:hypothetical protein
VARYMRTDLGRGHTKLSPPAVIGGSIAWHGPGVYLSAPDSANQRNRRQAHSSLQPPAVVAEPVVQRVFPGIRRYLVARKVRLERINRKTTSRLEPPAVIGAGRVNPGLRVKLTFGQRGAPHSKLSPPAVVAQPVTEVFSGPPPTLAPQRRGRATYDLAPPIVIDSGAALGWLATTLAPQRRGQAKSFLGEPVVAPAVVQVYYGPEVTLAPQRRGQTMPVLRGPVVVNAAEIFYGPHTHVAPQRRGAPHSFLQPPRVVFGAVEIYGPEVHLTRITPPPTVSVLRAPVVVTPIAAEVFYGPDVRLTYSRRPVTKSALRAPAVIGAGRVNPGLRVKLTFGQRGVAKSQLFPPAVQPVVAVAAIGQLQVNLTYSRRGRPVYGLGRASRVVVEGPQGGVLISLAPQRRGRPKSILRKPTVVTPVVVVYSGPSTTLTYSRRGRPKSILRPPRVVAAAPVRAEVLPPWLTYSRRGRPTSFLSPPTRVFPFFARRTDITLAPQRRGRPKSILRGPQVVRLAVEIYGPETWLSYSRRGRPQYRLEPPAVVGKAPFRGIKTWLTRIKPRPTVALLKPPTVVRVPIAGQLQVHLTYSRRGRPVYFTTPFTPGKAPFRPIQVHLTRITPRPTVSLIKPPAVVGAGIAFFGPSVTLVRITPPPVISFLKLTLVAFRRPGGDVCGFDIAGSFVCYLEVPGSQVSGSQRAGAQVSGSSRPGSIVTGSENAGSSVSGSDRKAT